MVGWIGGALRGLWVGLGPGMGRGHGAARLYLFLYVVFFVIAAVLVALGIDLDRVDGWLNDHADIFDRIGTIAFKALLGFILLVCVMTVGSGLLERGRSLIGHRDADGPRFGWGQMLFALVVGYFAWVGLFM